MLARGKDEENKGDDTMFSVEEGECFVDTTPADLPELEEGAKGS